MSMERVCIRHVVVEKPALRKNIWRCTCQTDQKLVAIMTLITGVVYKVPSVQGVSKHLQLVLGNALCQILSSSVS